MKLSMIWRIMQIKEEGGGEGLSSRLHLTVP